MAPIWYITVVFVCLFDFPALCPQQTAEVMLGWSVSLQNHTFPGQAKHL